MSRPLLAAAILFTLVLSGCSEPIAVPLSVETSFETSGARGDRESADGPDRAESPERAASSVDLFRRRASELAATEDGAEHVARFELAEPLWLPDLALDIALRPRDGLRIERLAVFGRDGGRIAARELSGSFFEAIEPGGAEPDRDSIHSFTSPIEFRLSLPRSTEFAGVEVTYRVADARGDNNRVESSGTKKAGIKNPGTERARNGAGEQLPFSYLGVRPTVTGLARDRQGGGDRLVIGEAVVHAEGLEHRISSAGSGAPSSGGHADSRNRSLDLELAPHSHAGSEGPASTASNAESVRYLQLAYSYSTSAAHPEADRQRQKPETPGTGTIAAAEPRLSVTAYCAADASPAGDFELLPRPGSHSIYIHGGILGCVPARLRIEDVPPGLHLDTLRHGTVTAGEHRPIPADLGVVLQHFPQSAWRLEDYEIFSWSRYPEILVMDTRSYAVQARFFKRLAFFVEKRGFRGRLLSDDELSKLHGWNAHNYRAEGLAGFFNQARRDGFELNEEERSLRDMMLANGVLRREGDQLLPGRGGIISISQESSALLRDLLLSHEAFHGVFYANAEFRAGVYETWEALSSREREYWRRMLSYLTYDPEDRYLMINEFQAYVLQQAPSRVRGYLRGTLSRRFAASRGAGYVDSFLAAYPDTFARAGRLLNRLAWDTARLRGGAVYDLR